MEVTLTGKRMSIKHAIWDCSREGRCTATISSRAYENEVAPSTQLNFGQVYSTLDRLHKGGLVTPERISQLERPDKKFIRHRSRQRDCAIAQDAIGTSMDVRTRHFSS